MGQTGSGDRDAFCQMPSQASENERDTLVLFHDGACPLCQAEMVVLEQLSAPGSIKFVDIHGPEFEVSADGMSQERALEVMHGRIGEDKTIGGVDVFAAAYHRANMPIAYWLVTRRALRPLLELGYRFFAKHREAFSRILGPLALSSVKRWYGFKPSRQPSDLRR